MKWWIGSGCLALIVVAGGGCFLAYGLANSAAKVDSGDPASRVSAALRVEVVHPRPGGLQRTTVMPGTVQAFETVSLYAGVSGYLKTQTVDIGDRVKCGQVLATVAVPDLEKQVQRHASALEQARARVVQMNARVRSANADLVAAQASVLQAQATQKSAAAWVRFRLKQLQRMKDLFATRSIEDRLVDESQERYEAAIETENSAEAAINTTNAQVVAAQAKVHQAEADVLEAESEVKVVQAELEKAQVMVSFATIAAPFNGVITHRTQFPGDYVRAAGDSGAHAPLLIVHRTDLLRVVVQIPDRDVPYANVGDLAIVEIDALPGKKFEAKVARLAESEDPQTRLMHLEIDLPNPTGKICHGMYGRVTIVLEQSNQLAIPTSCLVESGANGRASVYVVRDGHAWLTPVDVGSDNGLNVAIPAGLKAEDAVVLHPGNGLANGVAVSIAPAGLKTNGSQRH